jgi:hypothetical protein
MRPSEIALTGTTWIDVFGKLSGDSRIRQGGRGSLLRCGWQFVTDDRSSCRQAVRGRQTHL